MSSVAGPVAPPEAKNDNAGLITMYREMTLQERRTFWGCFAGWSLDGMDFMLYPLVIGTLIALWEIERGTAGLAVTVTLLSSALGGWLAGYLADRIGRVRTLQITILWFSGFSLICAFAQDFTQLMIFRALLGLGFGGEWTAGAVLICAVRLGGRLGPCRYYSGGDVHFAAARGSLALDVCFRCASSDPDLLHPSLCR